MKCLKKHFGLVLLVLSCAGAFNPLAWGQEALRLAESRLPADAFSANPGSSGFPAGVEAGQGTSQTRTVHVIGRGTIYRDNVARARDNAIADALQGVVEAAIGLLVSPSWVVQNFQLLSDRVYNETEAFIHDYKVLTESKSGRYYRVVVQATVSMHAIEEKLSSVGILAMRDEMPEVIFFLSEQNIGEPSPRYWWGKTPFGQDRSVTENVIAEYMGKKGFIIVDRASVAQDVQLGREYAGPELTDDAALKLGRKFRADLVIVGKAVARHTGDPSDNNMKSIQATVWTRAINADTGTIIASSDETKGLVGRNDGAGGGKALILSASAVAEDLTRQIVANWGKEVSHSVLVELVVDGIKEYADFVRFRKHLRNDIRGVRNVYLRSISAGGAIMDVDIMGSAKVLADDLMLQPFENLVVNILEVSEEGVRLELIPDGMSDS